MEAEVNSTRRMEHLWRMLESTAVTCPALSRFYAAEMIKLGAEARIPIGTALRTRLCARCAAPIFPGLTARIRLMPLKRLTAQQNTQVSNRVGESVAAGEGSGKAKVKNAVLASCLLCGGTSAWPASVPKSRTDKRTLIAPIPLLPPPTPITDAPQYAAPISNDVVTSSSVSLATVPPLAKQAPKSKESDRAAQVKNALPAASTVAPALKRRRAQQRRSLESMLATQRTGNTSSSLTLDHFLDAA